MFRLRYTLTDSAKEAAKDLVKDWDNGSIRSRYNLVDKTGGAESDVSVLPTLGVSDKNFKSPPIYDLYELESQGLIGILREKDEKDGFSSVSWEIQLSQELRNAVANDFRKGINLSLIAILIAFVSLIVSLAAFIYPIII